MLNTELNISRSKLLAVTLVRSAADFGYIITDFTTSTLKACLRVADTVSMVLMIITALTCIAAIRKR